jgi:O-antigen ligase
MTRYRTISFLITIAGLLYAGLRFCAEVPSTELAESLFATYAFGLAAIASLAAGKSLGEHLARGGGVKNAIHVLMTEDKSEGGE